MSKRISEPTTRAVAGLVGGAGFGMVGGFVASLLRRRPPTSYTDTLRSSAADVSGTERVDLDRDARDNDGPRARES